MPQTGHTIAHLLDRIEGISQGRAKVSLGDLVEATGARSYGPAIMLPALLELTPVGAVPGVPTFLALTIILFAAQMMIGRKRPWMPRLFANRSIDVERLERATARLRPAGRLLDRHLARRLKFMTRAPFLQIAAGLVILLCLTVPFLEILPFASSVPMLAIAGFGLAVLMRDGVLMLIALAFSFGALGMGLDYWDGGLDDTEAVDGLIDQQTIDTVGEGAEAVSDAASEMGGEIGQAAQTALASMSEVASATAAQD